ncbi:MAG: preprotein translocase subunit SecG [Thiobacillus sp.]|nr:preprotein translocase subunit SecG [Thiobacillus sp.]
METLVWIFHIVVAVAVVVLVLLQQGKGADMGAAFGSGSAGSLFGATGSANFLSRSTAILATLFFLTSLGLAYFGLQQHKPSGSVTERTAVPAPAQSVPVPAQPNGSKAGDIPQ